MSVQRVLLLEDSVANAELVVELLAEQGAAGDVVPVAAALQQVPR